MFLNIGDEAPYSGVLISEAQLRFYEKTVDQNDRLVKALKEPPICNRETFPAFEMATAFLAGALSVYIISKSR